MLYFLFRSCLNIINDWSCEKVKTLGWMINQYLVFDHTSFIDWFLGKGWKKENFIKQGG